jgi:hypothetical protein
MANLGPERRGVRCMICKRARHFDPRHVREVRDWSCRRKVLDKGRKGFAVVKREWGTRQLGCRIKVRYGPKEVVAHQAPDYGNLVARPRRERRPHCCDRPQSAARIDGAPRRPRKRGPARCGRAMRHSPAFRIGSETAIGGCTVRLQLFPCQRRPRRPTSQKASAIRAPASIFCSILSACLRVCPALLIGDGDG